MISIPLTAEAQTASDFETRMKAYTDSYIEKNTNRYNSESEIMKEIDTLSESDFKNYLAEQAKSKFIVENMKEYLNIYFPPATLAIDGDTLVCDNGGFEEDFQYYEGYISAWHNGFGGSSCNPYFIDVQGKKHPITYTHVPIPIVNRFEIVNAGYDSPFGIKKVKFGNKAARINNKLGTYQGNDTCYFFSEIDRIEKKFKVTDSTKDFTIWYAVVLQNPEGHRDRQPFFNISCDRDPIHELCFDANFLKCIDNYNDENCDYPLMKILDWSCHRFKIPNEFIDSIATLTITVADCAQNGDLGFAYIDGICEPCYGSALGLIDLNSIDYNSCYEPEQVPIARICGKITPPTFNKKCDFNNTDYWEVINFNIPGYDIYNLEIYNNNTFCFDFPLSNFKDFEDCIEIFAEATFTNGIDTLPAQLSNSLKICQGLYRVYDCNGGEIGPIDTCGIVIDIRVGGCNSNGTGGDNDLDQTPNMSDDYYYVYVSLYDPDTIGWRIDRDLVDPYPNENDIYTLASGEMDTINLVLGPFLIHEGDWWLEAYMQGCPYSALIEAPDYCSGCEEFRDAEIGNVECDDNETPGDPSDDKWSFTINVPNPNSPPPPMSLQFDLVPLNGGPSDGSYDYNVSKTIDNIPFDDKKGCLEYTLSKINSPVTCESKFIICQPKPCSDDCERFDANVQSIDCTLDPRTQQYTGYSIDLEIEGLGDNVDVACISYATTDDPDNFIYYGSYSNGIWTLDGFDSDMYMKITKCPSVPGCTCDSKCQKIIYIPRPDCLVVEEIRNREIKNSSDKGERYVIDRSTGELSVIPNPFSSDEFILHSTMKHTEYSIFDSSAKLILKGEFEGAEQKLKLNLSKGTYIVKFTDSHGKPAYVKMIKI